MEAFGDRRRMGKGCFQEQVGREQEVGLGSSMCAGSKPNSLGNIEHLEDICPPCICIPYVGNWRGLYHFLKN